jgi:hypothetical protein
MRNGRNFFKKFPKRFELTPDAQPNQVRYPAA